MNIVELMEDVAEIFKASMKIALASTLADYMKEDLKKEEEDETKRLSIVTESK